MSTDPVPSPPPPVQNDPFPRMITICIAIAALLLVIIFTTIFIDLVAGNRAQQEVKPFELFDAPPGTTEGNPLPITHEKSPG